MAKPKLGTGQRFKTVTKSVRNKQGYSEDRAEAIAAAIGRKKYGPKKMSDLAGRGRRRKANIEDAE